MNYGAIGVVIGHELTHGFDDQGRKFDGEGNLRDWWTAADAKAFESRADCIANEYSGFTPVDDVKLNGRLTLGENAADNGGIHLAYMALMDTPGGQGSRKRTDSRRAAILSGIRADLVREYVARNRAASAPDGSAFAGRVSRERRGAEHARVSEGFLLQGRAADGFERSVPGLVEPLRAVES